MLEIQAHIVIKHEMHLWYELQNVIYKCYEICFDMLADII